MISLTYFGVRGRVEPLRLMLELTRTPYSFEAMPVDVWKSPEGKPRFYAETPFAQLPILRDGDLVLCQSQAILRHLARKLGLAGDDAITLARNDEVCETALEFQFDLSLQCWTPDFLARRAAMRDAVAARLARVASYFERVRADALHWTTPGRWLSGDVVMALACECVMMLHPGLLADFPSLEAAMRAFFAEPGVHAYVTSERRPRTWTVASAPFGGSPETTHQFAAQASSAQAP